MWRDGDWGWWFLMPVVIVGFWAAVIWAIATAVRGRPMPSSTHAGGPEQILAERYARGDIDDEYRHRLDTLRGRTPLGEDR